MSSLGDSYVMACERMGVDPGSISQEASDRIQSEIRVRDIAKLCHEANRAFCQSIGDDTQRPWADAHEWQRASAIESVEWLLANPDAPASALHDKWVAEKERKGWRYGPAKDADAKEHDCLVPFERLPPNQQFKDTLMMCVVKACVAARLT